MKKKKQLYPGVDAAEKERTKAAYYSTRRGRDSAPDFIGTAPNYDKFPGVDPSIVLAWLNID